MDNVVEKIRKLLAKATSQNEHEAQAALLKARELMAKHKISEKEIGDAKPANRKLVTVEFTDATWSGYKNSWFPNLGGVIADNHCCLCVVSNVKGSQVHVIKFVGLGDDPIICMEIFRYAVDAIRNKVAEYKKDVYKKVEDQRTRNYHMKRIENGYAVGFAVGLSDQYQEQFKTDVKASDSMAIVMVRPKEVEDFMNTMTESKVKMHDAPDYYAMKEGQQDGYKFNPAKRISAEKEVAV